MLSCKPRVRLLQQIVARMVQHLPIMSLRDNLVLTRLQHLKRPQLELTPDPWDWLMSCQMNYAFSNASSMMM